MPAIPGGGGTSILTVTGTCRWTGYDFAVITIDTGYLNRPNWLLADYSVYHRVASQPTMFMTSPRSRHQRGCARRTATDVYECMMIHSRRNRPSVPVQGMQMKVLVRYMLWQFFVCVRRAVWDRVRFSPPSCGTPVHLRGECPPPPPPPQ